MLSYRHAFHAGNHADVLKHSVLCILLRHFTQKEAPFTYIDTHSGAGLYRIDGEWAQKTLEAQGGIVKLLEGIGQKNDCVPQSLREYVSLCAGYLANFQYPGSPEIALNFGRMRDCFILSELHPNEAELLRANAAGDPRIHVHFRNGFELLTSLALKPRSLILIDPSYETDSDYSQVFAATQKALKRCKSAVAAVWYPLLERRSLETLRLTQNLRALCCDEEKIMQAQLFFAEKSTTAAGYGMYGSGMLVLNAPWKCAQETEQSLACVSSVLNMHFELL